MRFREIENTSIPVIDLIPMLTVMMGVLAFFVVISVSLSNEQLIEVDLPSEQTEDTPAVSDTAEELFIVEKDATGQQFLNGAPMTTEQLTLEVEGYLARNRDSVVYLLPSRELPYEEVMQFLGDMRSVGGDRVSLALEENTAENTAENAAETAANATNPSPED